MHSREEKLTGLVKRLQEAAGTNLESVVLYGSAVRGGFRESHSDLNVLCTMRSLAIEELARVAPVVSWWSKEMREPAPLFFTAEELRQAAGVFSIELLDIQKSHNVLHGPDVVSAISVPMNLHRVQLEHDLRTLLLKLRRHYLHAPENREELTAVLAKSFSGVLTLLRHTLIAFGQEPPGDPLEVIGRVAVLTGCDPSGLQAVRELRESGRLTADLQKLYGSYLAAIESVIRALELRLPKAQWRRAAAGQS